MAILAPRRERVDLDRYVAKPWDAAELKAVLEKAMAAYEGRACWKRRIAKLEEEVARERRLREGLERQVPESLLAETLAAHGGG